jgi:hypothetical protein
VLARSLKGYHHCFDVGVQEWCGGWCVHTSVPEVPLVCWLVCSSSSSATLEALLQADLLIIMRWLHGVKLYCGGLGPVRYRCHRAWGSWG